MEKNKLIAVLAVLILAVAGVAAVVMLYGGNDSKKIQDYGGELQVYGNANEDSVIDEDDIRYIEECIVGDVDETAFCDANNDGTVDQRDVEQVRKMLSREDGLTVWYIDGNYDTSNVVWPLDKIVVLANSPQLMALAVGLDDSKIIGYTKEDSILFKSFEGAKTLTTSDPADFEGITAAGVPDAVIIGNLESRVIDASVRALYNRAGIDIIPILGMDGEESSSSALTLGYLVDCEERSQKYADWCHDMLSAVEDKVASLEDADRRTALVWFALYAAAGIGNDYTKALEASGGKTIADWNNYKMLNADNGTWILNYDPEYIIRIFTMGYGSSPEVRENLYEMYGEVVKPMNAYKNGKFCVIDFTLPQTLRIAYMAEFMYPELFEDGFADEWHQKLMDIYGIDFKVDGQFIITAEEYNKKS
ncbi:MAG: hypothetical protein LBR42_04660 [Candidatus Methanoplasma sp.]|jgi:ABC-type Fe3+-hydroxamate transport system substrate-binding protein|nr:hypothetical protein [Candidatus Methanoplasma sp.]